jgi:hypothetical protein
VTPRDILLRAGDLISQGWCQDADARSENGERVHPWSPLARSWSLLGSLMATEGVGRSAIGRLPVHELGQAIVVLGEAARTHSLEAWNDNAARTRADVLAVVDDALLVLRAGGGTFARSATAADVPRN